MMGDNYSQTHDGRQFLLGKRYNLFGHPLNHDNLQPVMVLEYMIMNQSQNCTQNTDHLNQELSLANVSDEPEIVLVRVMV